VVSRWKGSKGLAWHSGAADASPNCDSDGEHGAILRRGVLPIEAKGGVPTESPREVAGNHLILGADGLRLIGQLVAVDYVAHLRACCATQGVAISSRRVGCTWLNCCP